MFSTRVAGIPCNCQVKQESWDGCEISITTFDFKILDNNGRHGPWLERKLLPEDSQRLLDEYLLSLWEEYFNPY